MLLPISRVKPIVRSSPGDLAERSYSLYPTAELLFMNVRLRVSSLLLFSLLTTTALAQLPSGPGDFPGWRGADRTGLSPEKGLLATWPKDGPKQVLKITGLGGGYSTPTIAAGKLYVLGSTSGKEQMHCFSIKDGSKSWSAEMGREAGGYPGPRCSVGVDGDLAYALGSDGTLVCVNIKDGSIAWKKNLKSDFGGQTGSWAYAESPLIDGNNLICTPGGSTATIVCLNKTSGKEIWKSSINLESQAKGKGKGKGKSRSYNTAGYSSAIVAEVAGVKQYIQFLGGGVVGVDAKDGKLLWNYDAPANGTANCSTVLFKDDSVFAASGYGNGGGRAKITKDGDGFKAEQLYFVSTLQNHHGGMVMVDDHVYGTSNSGLMCVNFKTGEVAWTARGVGKGSVMYADGHIYHRSEKGDIALVEANPKKYEEKGRFSQPDRSKNNAWPYPVIAGGKLWLRDWDVLLCYDIKGAS
jgi:outer membrane protein assembly factor BamB